MTIEPVSIGTAKNGSPTASVGTVRIHSAYNPEKEAVRYLAGLDVSPKPGALVVILGAGLGYLDKAFASQFPRSPILAIHFDEVLYKFRHKSDEADAVIRWHPGTNLNILDFFYSHINEEAVAGLTLVEWPASNEAMTRRSDEVSNALAQVVRRHTGNISATAAFGRRWIKNSFRNFIDTESLIVPQEDDTPIVLAASGPSLEGALDTLRRYRKRFRLWALPSSLAALNEHGIQPDLVFTTDPGHWARIHSRYLDPETPLAMPLSGAPMPMCRRRRLLISQDTPGEAELMKAATWPEFPVPAMGTVAATAVETWSIISTGPLFLVGLDLAWKDLQGHARPHTFDGWFACRASRTYTELTVAWEKALISAPEKSGMTRTGPALKTYADWFRGLSGKKCLYRFDAGPSEFAAAELPGIPEIDESAFDDLPNDLKGESFFQEIPASMSKDDRRAFVKDLLFRWRQEIESPDAFSNNTARNLMYALDPGGAMSRYRESKSGGTVAAEEHRENAAAALAGMEGNFG